MKNKTEKLIIFSIFVTFVLIFSAFNASAATDTAGTPTPAELAAFQDLASTTNHPTAWPIVKVEDGSITLDGKLDDAAWGRAKRFFTTGEWFWNDKTTTMPWLYSGLMDFIAIWRVLYDSKNMYVSCEFFDDKHRVGSGTDPWNRVDAVELTVKLPDISVGGMGAATILSPTYRIWRRFTATPGNIGMKDTVRYPGSITGTGWRATEPEGSSRLGGIACAAAPISNAAVRAEFPGAWAMEIKIPLIGSAVDSNNMPVPIVVDGKAFKMNLRIFDQDDTTITADNFTNVGTNRFAVPWYYKVVTLESANYPTFIFAGGNASNPYPLPDEPNLYCGMTADNYEYLTLRLYTLATETPQGVFPASTGVIGVFPSPLIVDGNLEFNLEKADMAGLRVFNARGALAMDAGTRYFAAGRNLWRFNSRDKLAPGIYVLRLAAGGREFTKQISVVR
jgi:hypothetical protein